jgi:CRP-like cAMP-binding protein
LRGRLERHGSLSQSAHAALQQIHMTSKIMEPGSYIVREADAPSMCGILVSGFAYRQKVTGQGARQILAVGIPGDVVDLQNLYLRIADHSVQMLTEGEVLSFPRAALQDVAATEPAVARAILIETLLEASILREWLVNIGRRKGKTRLAHLLCEFAMRLESTRPTLDAEYELPMNQEHLGDALGLTSVHLNRMLRELSNDGLVRWTRKFISLPDWRKLREVGDFNSRYLHLDQTRRD